MIFSKCLWFGHNWNTIESDIYDGTISSVNNSKGSKIKVYVYTQECMLCGKRIIKKKIIGR